MRSTMNSKNTAWIPRIQTHGTSPLYGSTALRDRPLRVQAHRQPLGTCTTRCSVRDDGSHAKASVERCLCGFRVRKIPVTPGGTSTGVMRSTVSTGSMYTAETEGYWRCSSSRTSPSVMRPRKSSSARISTYPVSSPPLGDMACGLRALLVRSHPRRLSDRARSRSVRLVTSFSVIPFWCTERRGPIWAPNLGSWRSRELRFESRSPYCRPPRREQAIIRGLEQ